MSLDGEALRNQVLLDIPELCWLSVNVSGCRAYVQVRSESCAGDAGRGNALQRGGAAGRTGDGGAGQKTVVSRFRAGTAVTEGQLLISAWRIWNTFGARVLAGKRLG